ncbi:MAG: peptidoglycan DD-metalloendopeptidase family protein [Candidatus Eisenbacteria bacterium]
MITRTVRLAAALLSLAAAIVMTATVTAAPAAATTTTDVPERFGVSVSPQGTLASDGPRVSGEFTWRVEVEDGPANPFSARVVVTGPEGITHHIAALGEAFLVSDLGLVVAVRRPETRALRATVEVLDLEGNTVWTEQAWDLASPTLSPNGRILAYLSRGGLTTVDLTTLEAASHPRLLPFAVSDEGALAGVPTDAPLADGAFGISVLWPGARESRTVLSERPLRVAFTHDGRSALVLSSRSLRRIDADGGSHTMFSCERDEALRDLAVTRDGIAVGTRRTDGSTFSGAIVELDDRGLVVARRSGPSRAIPRHPGVDGRGAALRGNPWPLAPDAQQDVGNTYGEYQDYGGSPYLHPGVDVLGAAGQPVYAVAGGYVKAVLTTSAQWHWRVALSDSNTSGTSTGYLYAHLDEPTITVSVGDTVLPGEYLGDLVEWPVAGFHHVHFVRLEDTGAQWYGNWDSIDNPHIDFDVHGETEAPVFEPARGSDLLAFCSNQTSSYLEPDALVGSVDIIAHVGDRVQTNWVCSVQEIRYTIYPVGHPEFPVVDDKLAVNFDMLLDTYYGGPIDPFLVGLLYKQDGTCATQGDYDYREFYHIITNSDGNEVYETSDLAQAWDTTWLPDADFVIRVTATDAAGNATVDSMTVTTANGNPTWVPPAGGTSTALGRPFPNPAADAAVLSFSTPSMGPVALRVYSPAGRLVRTLVSGDLPAGPHAVGWDLLDSRGLPVGSGVYLIMLDAGSGTRTRKLAIMR